MVSAHCWLKPYSAKTAGQTPGQQVRYLKREGEFDPVHYVERTGGRTKDYRDYVTGAVQNLPAWSGNDPHRFFAAAKAFEGRNRYYAFQVEFSLPKELTHEQHLVLTKDFMQATMPDLPALWVKHEKRLESGDLHPHIHILFSARKQDGIERDEVETFQRWNRDNPAQGGCEKDLFWSKQQAPEHLRQAFADISNYHLSLGNAEERIDPRSLQRRELYRKAVGRGLDTPLDAATKAKEQARAVQAWEQRQAYKQLGDMQAIPREEFVLLVRQWMHEGVPNRERRYKEHTTEELATHKAALEGTSAHMERIIQDIERHQRGERLPPHKLRSYLAGAGLDVPHGKGLTMHLYEKEREESYGR